MTSVVKPSAARTPENPAPSSSFGSAKVELGRPVLSSVRCRPPSRRARPASPRSPGSALLGWPKESESRCLPGTLGDCHGAVARRSQLHTDTCHGLARRGAAQDDAKRAPGAPCFAASAGAGVLRGGHGVLSLARLIWRIGVVVTADRKDMTADWVPSQISLRPAERAHPRHRSGYLDRPSAVSFGSSV